MSGVRVPLPALKADAIRQSRLLFGSVSTAKPQDSTWEPTREINDMRDRFRLAAPRRAVSLFLRVSVLFQQLADHVGTGLVRMNLDNQIR